MAIQRRAPKQDIRSLDTGRLRTIAPTPVHPERTLTEHHDATIPLPETTMHDLKRIAWSTAPLILLIIVGSYLDIHHHWVVNFAQWLSKIGS